MPTLKKRFRDVVSVAGPAHLGCALRPDIKPTLDNCSWCGTDRLTRDDARRRHLSLIRCHECRTVYTEASNRKYGIQVNYRQGKRIARSKP